jgi:excinuclease ABC subunit C
MERAQRQRRLHFENGTFAGFGPSRFHPVSDKPLWHSTPNPGADQLRDHVREHAPRHPGCYGMLDRNGRVIYIGKAKSLRSRLMSYFRVNSRDPKAGRILDHTKTLLWEQTADEFSALLRELELIRRFRPKYNVLGQPGPRRYIYLCLGRKPSPYVYLTRQPTGKEIACYGPLMGRGFADEAVRRLNDWYQLRDCSSRIPMMYADQPELFPVERAAQCLRYDLGTCLGPCAGFCSQSDYTKGVRRTKAFLDGKDNAILNELATRMTEASQLFQFERAMALRDRLTALSWLADRLQFLRNARMGGAFIYKLAASDGRMMWYLIHRGEVQGVLRQPGTDKQKRTALELMQEVFAPKSEDAVRSDRACDSVLLVAAWFRNRTEEKEHLISYDDVKRELLTSSPSA